MWNKTFIYLLQLLVRSTIFSSNDTQIRLPSGFIKYVTQYHNGRLQSLQKPTVFSPF